MEVSLPLQGLKRLTEVELFRPFTFIVGEEEQQFSCSQAIACFLSGKVCKLLKDDPTVTSLRLNPSESASKFQVIMDMVEGKTVTLTVEDAINLVAFSCELENEELTETFSRVVFSEPLTIDNVAVHLRMKERMGKPIDPEISFIAKEMFKIKFEMISSLSVEHLQRVLSHRDLKLTSESSLLSLICEFIKVDPSYSVLLRCVQIEYLDVSSTTMYFDLIRSHNMEKDVWDSMKYWVVAVKKDSAAVSMSVATRHRSFCVEVSLMYLLEPRTVAVYVTSNCRLRDVIDIVRHTRSVRDVPRSGMLYFGEYDKTRNLRMSPNQDKTLEEYGITDGAKLSLYPTLEVEYCDCEFIWSHLGTLRYTPYDNWDSLMETIEQVCPYWEDYRSMHVGTINLADNHELQLKDCPIPPDGKITITETPWFELRRRCRLALVEDEDED